jgi:ATP-binding cassette subfamily F protein 3
MIKNLTKSFEKKSGDKLTVFENFSATIERAEKLAVVGVNGAGKSTLLRLVIGELEATNGAATLGPSIKAGYFGKSTIESLVTENNLTQELARLLPHASDGLIRNILAAFLFKGDDVYKKVRHLSGGEKARLVLAWLLSSNFNFLILDEPTNHLDIHSREVLLDALKRYEGTIAIVSHDRFFLREISTKVLEISKGNAHLYQGNYEEYLSSMGN